ncbi:hypothetical protein GMLC_27200 [Geomonas limicola]|uniref:Uncharacterized protein n=1 Tax=Geomonas limicola TaxID=2740186 RepID=A0A6V8N9D0_9BACT|nr:hypothetical protein GMLC_27200 [Geomonas limicola]
MPQKRAALSIRREFSQGSPRQRTAYAIKKLSSLQQALSSIPVQCLRGHPWRDTGPAQLPFQPVVARGCQGFNERKREMKKVRVVRRGPENKKRDGAYRPQKGDPGDFEVISLWVT